MTSIPFLYRFHIRRFRQKSPSHLQKLRPTSTPRPGPAQPCRRKPFFRPAPSAPPDLPTISSPRNFHAALLHTCAIAVWFVNVLLPQGGNPKRGADGPFEEPDRIGSGHELGPKRAGSGTRARSPRGLRTRRWSSQCYSGKKRAITGLSGVVGASKGGCFRAETDGVVGSAFGSGPRQPQTDPRVWMWCRETGLSGNGRGRSWERLSGWNQASGGSQDPMQLGQTPSWGEWFIEGVRKGFRPNARTASEHLTPSSFSAPWKRNGT